MNDIHRVKQALETGPASLNSFSPDGWTPLHLAAFFGFQELVHLLLKEGAAIDIPSKSRASHGNSPLQAAIAMGRLEVVQLLLDEGANVNFLQEPSRLTPLHIAASRKDVGIVRLLLERGANRDAISADGKKPVDIARERQNADVAEIL
jgi:ankyrin repeat protein